MNLIKLLFLQNKISNENMNMLIIIPDINYGLIKNRYKF